MSWSTKYSTGNFKQMHGNSKKKKGQLVIFPRFKAVFIRNNLGISYKVKRYEIRSNSLAFPELHLFVFFEKQVQSHTILTLFRRQRCPENSRKQNRTNVERHFLVSCDIHTSCKRARNADTCDVPKCELQNLSFEETHFAP